jgi:REP element-mobilizing transposase RayT
MMPMAQSYAGLFYHLIFSTKHRLPQIGDDWGHRLYEYIGGIIRDSGGALIAAGGMPDHVHLLTTLPKTLSISDGLRIIKTNSSLWIHQTWPERHDFVWQGGYGAFTVSASGVEDVRRYIANQREHHRHRTFQEEFVEFLKAYQVPYDKRYIWD